MSKKKILIVEDEPLLRKNIVEILNTLKLWNVLDVSNANKALEILEELQPDLIISDYKMPGINGLEFLGIVREHHKMKTTPFIFLTAKMDIILDIDDDKTSILYKPFSFKVLVQHINTVMQNAV